MDEQLYGGIEAGGTKFLCAIGTATGKIIAKTHIPTTSPGETLDKVIDFFSKQPKLRAMGIASFGPIDINKQSKTYGYITTTSKPGWRNTDLVGPIVKALNVPIALDTDVNGAALGEQLYGAGKNLDSIAYMTVGTGIGVGCIINNQVLGGFAHTETGHMLIPYSSRDTHPLSSCPYHETCLEGLASGSSLKLRYGKSAEQLDDDKAWSLEAYYLAVGIVNIIYSLAPRRIIIGGGVLAHQGLIQAIRAEVPKLLNSYLQIPEILDNLEDYITLPELGDVSGITGAIIIGSRLAS